MISSRRIQCADPVFFETSYYVEPDEIRIAADPVVQYMGKSNLEQLIAETQTRMEKAAKELDFLEAARLRDELFQLRDRLKAESK